MVEVDARGQQCPIPVVRAKKALREIEEGSVRVLVDNDMAVTNLTNLGATMKCEVTTEKTGDSEFAVTLEKTADSNTDAEFDTTCLIPEGRANRVVVIAKNTMGDGDDELGAILMKGFIFALTQQDELPQSILFYNSGIFLTSEGSPVLDDLRTLEEAGVEILTCGTCLNHYGIADKLQVGGVTNLYVVAEKQMKATVVIRP